MPACCCTQERGTMCLEEELLYPCERWASSSSERAATLAAETLYLRKGRRWLRPQHLYLIKRHLQLRKEYPYLQRDTCTWERDHRVKQNTPTCSKEPKSKKRGYFKTKNLIQKAFGIAIPKACATQTRCMPLSKPYSQI